MKDHPNFLFFLHYYFLNFPNCCHFDFPQSSPQPLENYIGETHTKFSSSGSLDIISRNLQILDYALHF